MEAMRQSWTDERLDDFRGDVNRRFDEVYRRFDKVDERFDKVQPEIAVLRSDMKGGFDQMNARFDSLQRSLLQASVVLIVAVVGLLGSQIS
jgi:hypothetical protein